MNYPGAISSLLALSLSFFTVFAYAQTEPLNLAQSTAQQAPTDPWQGFNRRVFAFNMGLDHYLLKPIAKAYVKTTPAFFRQGVDNALGNLLEVPSALNGLLQGNIPSAGHDAGRLLVNSTLGLGGLLDVAQHMGLAGSKGEDFGQTLAVWGVGSGPYVVLPILGPSTLRDSLSVPVDWATDPKTYIDHVPTSNSVRALSVVNTRANFLPLEKSLSGDKYIFIREAYLQSRNFDVRNGEVEDAFGADEVFDESSGY